MKATDNDDVVYLVDMALARTLLGLTQKQMAEALGWGSVRYVSAIETDAKPMTLQTSLALECLLRRAKKWNEYERTMG